MKTGVGVALMIRYVFGSYRRTGEERHGILSVSVLFLRTLTSITFSSVRWNRTVAHGEILVKRKV